MLYCLSFTLYFSFTITSGFVPIYFDKIIFPSFVVVYSQSFNSEEVEPVSSFIFPSIELINVPIVFASSFCALA